MDNFVKSIKTSLARVALLGGRGMNRQPLVGRFSAEVEALCIRSGRGSPGPYDRKNLYDGAFLYRSLLTICRSHIPAIQVDQH